MPFPVLPTILGRDHHGQTDQRLPVLCAVYRTLHAAQRGRGRAHPCQRARGMGARGTEARRYVSLSVKALIVLLIYVVCLSPLWLPLLLIITHLV